MNSNETGCRVDSGYSIRTDKRHKEKIHVDKCYSNS